MHRTVGPGLLEAAYEECLSHEMNVRGLRYERQKLFPVVYKATELNFGYRLDFLVERSVVVEIKVVEALMPVHQAQLLSYLKLGGWGVGLLINFNVSILVDGIKRVVMDHDPP